MKISICIPTYKRTDLLFRATEWPIMDDRISEIIIIDDCSDRETQKQIRGYYMRFTVPNTLKVFLYFNEKNLDCYRNKREAVRKATNEYVIILDSDNVLDKTYIDTVYAQHWSPERILQPTFARPHFDFRKYNSLLANRKNVSKYANDSTFTTALNAMNFFINREKYLEVWDRSVDPVTSDSIYFNYKWLEAGNSIYFTPGLEYEHTISSDSHYKLNNKRTPHGFHESILRKLKALR